MASLRAWLTTIVVSLWFPCALAAQADFVRFQHLQLEDGLSQTSVRTIMQDNRGFLWLGTQDGLNRYDGYNITVFAPDPDSENSISHNDIFATYQDRSGIIWIGTAKGLNRYDPTLERFDPFLHDPDDSTTLSHNHITAILEDSSGVLWIGTGGGGLHVFNRAEGTFSNLRHDPGDSTSLAHDVVNVLYIDRESRLWVGTDGGLDRFDGLTGRFVHHGIDTRDPQNPGSVSITALHEHTSGVLWIGTSNGLYSVDPDSNSFTAYRDENRRLGNVPTGRVTAILEDQYGVLWFGVDYEGLFYRDRESGRFSRINSDPYRSESLAADRVISLYEDRTGVLWVGTYSRGVDRFDRYHSKFSAQHSRPDLIGDVADYVRAFHVDRSGLLWIATDGGGLVRVDRKTGESTVFEHDPSDAGSLSSDRVFALFEDDEGKLWIGHSGGRVDEYQPTSGKFRRHQLDVGLATSISTNAVRSMLQHRPGAFLIGTDGGGVLEFDQGSRESNPFGFELGGANIVDTRRVFDLLQDSSGDLWLCLFGDGLIKLDGETGVVTRYKNVPGDSTSLSNDHVMVIHEDQNGAIWIGSNGGGLDKFDPSSGAFHHYREGTGLPNNAIKGILEDDVGNLWLSHNKGITRFNPETEIFKNYGVNDGLQSSEFNEGAYYRSTDGEMFFGGINGYNAFFPNNVRDYLQPPTVIVTDLQIYNQSVPIGEREHGQSILSKSITESQEITLGHRDRVISFEYAALEFGASEKVKYAYMMEGLDEGWNYVDSRRYATYTYLPPGRYTFRVKASNEDGVWNEDGVALGITIVPPFWRTVWFMVLMALFITAVIWGTHRYRTRLIRIRAWVLEKTVSERTAELKHEIAERKEVEVKLAAAHKEAVRATKSKSEFLANMSHEIRTPMNGVLGMAQLVLDSDDLSMEHRDQIETIHHSGESLLTIINDILDFSKIEAGKLDIEPIPFDLQVASAEVADLLAPKALEKSLELVFRYAPDAPRYLVGDPGRIRQIILNLAGNAIKFTSNGHVMIEIEGEEESEEEALVKVSIHDTGLGMDEEARSKLFKPFSQADASTTRKFGGTGLGLAISRQLVGMMGGEIGVESAPGKGSTFWFTLRLSRSPENPEGVPEVDLSGVRVLAVDDSAINRRVLKEQLRNLGMNPVVARGGAEGMELLREAASKGEAFPLTVLDYLMPGEDGEEIGRSIKADELVKATALVLLTSAGRPGDGKRLQEAGFAGYLVKPARPDDLRDVLATVWSEQQSGKAIGHIVTRHSVAEARAAEKPEKRKKRKSRARGWRVLVAEDNIVNQKVAQRMLEKLDCVVDVAANGEEAVDMWSKLPYDVVFMDCQMPEMDGYEATRQIRSLEGADRHTPVVAMTANAMDGDREVCLDAGMDDYLPKPVRMDECREILEKWAPDSGGKVSVVT